MPLRCRIIIRVYQAMEERIHILLAKKLSGVATTTELAELDQWGALTDENRAAISKTEALWGEADHIFSNGPRFDKAAAWQKISEKTSLSKADEVLEKKKGRRLWLPTSLAAAAIVIIGLFIFRLAAVDTTEIIAASGNKKITLPDNSVVELFKGSSIAYGKYFGNKNRNVTLSGNAFFDVARDEQLPFVIDARDAEVMVLGTSFYVESGTTPYVAVVTGKVSMTSGTAKQQLILTPGETGILTNGSMIEEQGSVADLMYWKTGEVSFKDVTLSRVIERLDKIFSEDIRLSGNVNEQTAQQKINISFKQQSIEAMLQELCLVSKCKLLKENDGYRIDTQ